MTQRRDTLFDTPIAQVPDFTFNEDVARVFPDMIKRSVPGYPTIVENSGVLAAQFARPHSLIYDLGCSLGAVTQAMRRHVTQPGCRILAVDNSPAMVGRCREYLKAQDAMHQELLPAEVAEADILQLELEPCSVVALNFTLQFIPPGRRLELLGNIQRQLLPGGALLLSEKLRFDDPEEHQLLNDLHLAFKRANGYSELEIAQKRRAIEKVMLPDTLGEHRQRLQEAGFNRIHLWFQCINFVSMIALP
ncbi:MAG: carboxy-S-adenosyl-L-methionine synthase CmoA [Gammaproteobacteria bacterium]|jgi:tRNA (cmo5U34)-methyltransferase|nr:carboxy-S-adenosyl-L-methionine synthase CmoA [Gammaproteobacteria bacterium]